MTEESVIIVGEHILLRDWRVTDVPILRSWLEPGHRWHETNTPYFLPQTLDEREARVARIVAGIASGAWETPRQRLPIVDRATDTLIGSVSWYWEEEETNWRSIGIVIYDPAYWGRGIGTDALRLWISYLFRTTDVARLDFVTWSGNGDMMRVGEKLGFTLEARFRNARIVRGKFYDCIVMGVLREEWKQQGPANG